MLLRASPIRALLAPDLEEQEEAVSSG